ncbi:hypothetical protein OHB35_53100 [Streptomyces phaeochromogenes]|uniref:Transposase IS701-like DDE domain-containing protein n=1 Tax=Streptomyces phaeochromogenes TaxID=1923 RepID=A0ABZ1HWY7_STRPH|nr:hypothetical protein OHB35_53100 [Streptomyces phaeochromogenes]
MSRARWDHDRVSDDLREYVTERLGTENSLLVIDETGDRRKGRTLSPPRTWCAVHDEATGRMAALQALGTRQADHKGAAELRLFLQARAVNDLMPEVRWEALSSLAGRHRDDETVRFLQWREREDVNVVVRDRAAELRAVLLSKLEEGRTRPLLAPSLFFDPGAAVFDAELLVETAMAAWRSRQYHELITLLPTKMVGVRGALVSWLRRHPDDLRLLMRDALRLAPDHRAQLSTAPSERLRRLLCAPSDTASTPRRGNSSSTAAGPPAISACVRLRCVCSARPGAAIPR